MDAIVTPINGPSTPDDPHRMDELIGATSGVETVPVPMSVIPVNSKLQPKAVPVQHRKKSPSEGPTVTKVSTMEMLNPLRYMPNTLRNIIGAGDADVRCADSIELLKDDIVAQNYRRLKPIELVESGPHVRDKPPPGDIHPITALLGLILLFAALGIASAPLFDTSIDAELLTDNSGLLVKKNASFAKAYFLGNGFYAEFTKTLKNNNTAVNWFPQPADTKFLNFTYMLPAAYASYGSGACAILNPDPANPIECILMTGHQGSVSTYGLCRNGSEFVSMHYLAGLVTPADVGGLVSAGTWIENTREVILIGLAKPPVCVDGKKIVVTPKLDDWRLVSGPFNAATRGVQNQWLDSMGLPSPIRERMFYLNGKGGGRLGITIPNSRRQSFDGIISQSIYGATLADKLEIQAPFAGSKHVFFTLYRVSGARIVLPRLQFTFAVAAQSLALLAFMLGLTLRNGPVRSYHLVVQILRLPTFCIISIQLLYVLYYQIFSIGYLAVNPTLHYVFVKKVVYVAGVSLILMHQTDVRAAVTLWPRMANNDSYYVARLMWMLGSLALFMWSLNQQMPDHYVVASRPNCPLGAMECNTTKPFFMQHWICFGIFVGHPIAYGIIQIAQWYRNRSEYNPRDHRHPDYITSFEAYGCGGPLSEYYYYHTLVTKEIAPIKLTENDGETSEDGGSPHRTLQFLTCAKAVRDEGFVLLGGCHALIRAKDLPVVLLVKLMPNWLAGTINLSIVIAYIVDLRLTPMRRVSYAPLWTVAHRWDGTVSYPDIG